MVVVASSGEDWRLARELGACRGAMRTRWGTSKAEQGCGQAPGREGVCGGEDVSSAASPMRDYAAGCLSSQSFELGWRWLTKYKSTIDEETRPAAGSIDAERASANRKTHV